MASRYAVIIRSNGSAINKIINIIERVFKCDMSLEKDNYNSLGVNTIRPAILHTICK